MGERVLHEGYVLKVVEGTFVGPSGDRFTRDIIRHPGAVGVVAVDGEEVVLVRQYRPVFDGPLLEIPAGTIDRADPNPEATAVRELGEEIGATAAVWEHLVSYWVAPGVSDERMHLFLATGLTFGPTSADGPEEASMTIERVRLDSIPELVSSGGIIDAKSIIGLLFLMRPLQGGGRRQ